MDASAIVKSSDHRPTLGKVSVGPLGATHQEVLDGILAKQRRSNPLKVCNDAIHDFFMGFFKCCDMMMPTRVNPELAAETARPWKSETVGTMSCLLGIVITGGILLVMIANATIVSNEWESNGFCEILDIIQGTSTSQDVKMLMRVTETPNEGIIQTESDARVASGNFVGHHPYPDHPNESHDPTPDNPFSCHIEKSKVEVGPCCHTTFARYSDFQIGDKFDCHYTFKTKYCNNVVDEMTDDDFRGFGVGPFTPEDPSGRGDPEEVHDHLNQICCEPELPINIASIMMSFIMCCCASAVLLWCLLFRAKHGVWSRLCPFDDPPPNSHIYDSHS